ncbi:MAG TPA: flagellar basal body P-ring formation chaperone FlgA [Planctomycetota bacterium]|nr:flagellar basal body P-ring formation chaperone FlgA [Planctomycetota bacterium]HRV80025.1 flagellar basal body P-ring formation chaperone FlgA [Planctomycetota bacterium]
MILSTLLLTFGGLTIQLPERVECVGVSLRLGDVATVTGDDAEQVARIQDVDLGYLPSPGYSRLLLKGQLHTAVLQSYPDAKIEFIGSNQTRVFPQIEVVTAGQIEAEARKVVRQKFAGLDVECELRGTLTDLQVPKGRKQVQIKARPASGPRGQGSQGVAVEIWVDDALWRTQWTSWEVAAWEEVAVLTTPVVRGEKLTPAMFKTERRRQAVNASARPLQPQQVMEAQAMRDLPAGQPVFQGDVERTKVIQRGNVVQVSVLKGRVTAVSTGLAQEDGRMGDQVRVVMSGTGKELVGTVAGTNNVLVRLR